MSSRPSHIDLPPNPDFDSRVGPSSPRSTSNIPSPRSGDVPPALSPLDAFALQGRLLATKFEEQDGRRISRLPPLTVANGFANRPTYFSRPFQAAEHLPSSHLPHNPEPSGNNPEVSRPHHKHTSFYPSIQADDNLPAVVSIPLPEKPTLEPVSEERSAHPDAAHPVRRPASPESMYNDQTVSDTSKTDFTPAAMRKPPTNESLQSNQSLNQGLAPPQRSTIFAPKSPRGTQPSIRSVRMDSGDDSDAISFQSDPYDLPAYQRKTSAKSGKERPRSPFSPTLVGRRSPSISSEISNTELQGPPRRSMNFSRPLSPAASRMPHRPSVDSRPSFDQSIRMLTVGSPPVRPSVDVTSVHDSENLEGACHPWIDDNGSSNFTDDEQQPADPAVPAAASYTYIKYDLPRGRKVVSNGSFKAQSWLAHQFEWDHPTLDNAHSKSVSTEASMHAHDYNPDTEITLARQPILPSIVDEPSPSPEPVERVARVPTASSKGFDDDTALNPIDQDPAILARSRSYDDTIARPMGQSRFHEEGIAEPLPRPKSQKSSSNLPRSPTNTSADSNISKSKPEAPAVRRKAEDKPHKSSEKTRLKDHIKDAPLSNPSQVPAEDHLAKGIELHENGNVQKATYHLRIAALAGLPSAMLLYALACRHGWGMRSNQQEAVLWLRKAVDISRLEVDNADADADHLLPPSFGGAQDKAAQKQHKAQLALSIYELGVSYLNGWGIQQDKALALRCFEIAAGWGDADALAEAGFCYAKGVGCKKNLTKAAGLYRRAEKQGISMAGNSW